MGRHHTPAPQILNWAFWLVFAAGAAVWGGVILFTLTWAAWILVRLALG